MTWWRRESVRQTLPLPLGLVGPFVPGDTVVGVLVAWDAYAIGYLVLTWYALKDRDLGSMQALMIKPKRSGMSRYLVTPPEQLSQGAAMLAMVATVVAMPQAGSLGTSEGFVLAVCAVAVVASWLTLHAGFLVVYLGLHTSVGGFRFPGEDEPTMVDFLYFALAVGTTFGTTDVEVTRSVVRRQALVHGVLSFVFNTLILAVGITVLTTYFSTRLTG